MKWRKTGFSEDYVLHNQSFLLISARVVVYKESKFEAWLWGALIDNTGSLGVFDSAELAKGAVEKRVRESLERIRKEIEN